MAGADGRRDPALIEVLRSEPYRFDVRQAVRLLEMLDVACVTLGAGSDPEREAVAVRGSLTSSFPPSDIEKLTLTTPDRKAELTVAFMGLAGAFGPLPPPLTARVVERLRKRDLAARDFLDLFNHRLVSLMLRQWRLFHPALQGSPLQPEMAARRPLLALLGLATARAPSDGRLAPLTVSLMASAGLLNPRPVSAHALERLLGGHFGVPARVVPFRGGWLKLAPDQWTRLGRRQQQPLGHHAVLGTRVWDQAAGIRIEIGPAFLPLFLAFLPAGAAHAQAARLLMLPLGERLDVSLRLILRAGEVPESFLGEARSGRSGTRLGWTSWLGRQPRAAPGAACVRLRPPPAGPA